MTKVDAASTMLRPTGYAWRAINDQNRQEGK